MPVVGYGASVTPDDVVREVRQGQVRPVYLVVGEERVLADRVISAVRQAVLSGAAADFNQDVLTAGEADVEQVLQAVRTAPMFAKQRLVLVRSVERWEVASADKGKASGDRAAAALERLAGYAAAPLDTACLLMTASKLDGRRKLMAQARAGGYLVSCEPVARAALPKFIERECRERGHGIDAEVADLVAEIAGPELSSVLDALDRLSLYVGARANITDDAVAACITRVRTASVWELLAALGRRDAAAALQMLHDVYEPQDRGLRLVGLLAWSTRQLLRFKIAQNRGANPAQAAQQSGVPPFRAREVAAQVRGLSEAEIEGWLAVLAEADLALKGSKRPPRSVLESAILTMTIRLPR